MTYLIWILIFVWLPASLLWIIVRPGRRTIKVALLLGVTSLVLFPIIEYLIIRYTMVLQPGKHLGIQILTLPLEDYVFFLAYPLFVFPVVIIVEQVMKERSK